MVTVAYTLEALAMSLGTSVEDTGGGVMAVVWRNGWDENGVEVLVTEHETEDGAWLVSVCPLTEHRHGDHVTDYREVVRMSRGVGEVTEAASAGLMALRDAGRVTEQP